jgi:hypothetical protein
MFGVANLTLSRFGLEPKLLKLFDSCRDQVVTSGDDGYSNVQFDNEIEPVLVSFSRVAHVLRFYC